jgi:hypothetical protein
MCLAAGLNVQRAAGAYAMPDDGTLRALAERTDHDRLVHKGVSRLPSVYESSSACALVCQDYPWYRHVTNTISK